MRTRVYTRIGAEREGPVEIQYWYVLRLMKKRHQAGAHAACIENIPDDTGK